MKTARYIKKSQQQEKMNKKNSGNWFKRLKNIQADASSGTFPETNWETDINRTRLPQDNFSSIQGVPYPLQEGDKIRLRNSSKSISDEQDFGRVKSIKGNLAEIKWETGKRKGETTYHDMDDPEKIAALFDKVQ